MTESKKFTYLLRNKFICLGANNINDFRNQYVELASMMDSWIKDGIKLLDDGGVQDDYSTFYTENKDVAKKHGFEIEEFDDDDEIEDCSSDKSSEKSETNIKYCNIN